MNIKNDELPYEVGVGGQPGVQKIQSEIVLHVYVQKKIYKK